MTNTNADSIIAARAEVERAVDAARLARAVETNAQYKQARAVSSRDYSKANSAVAAARSEREKAERAIDAAALALALAINSAINERPVRQFDADGPQRERARILAQRRK